MRKRKEKGRGEEGERLSPYREAIHATTVSIIPILLYLRKGRKRGRTSKGGKGENKKSPSLHPLRKNDREG